MTFARAMLVLLGVLSAGAGCVRRQGADALSPEAGIVGLPVPESRFTVLAPTATLRRGFGCSAYDLDTGAVFALDSAWVRRVDRAAMQSAESLFASLRGLPSFQSLPRADSYVRQYAGLEREGRRVAYLHASNPALFTIPGMVISWESLTRHPVQVCDGGAGIFGQFIDLETEARTRLEFSDSYAGRVTYPMSPPAGG